MNPYALINGLNSILSLSIAAVIFFRKTKKPIQLTYALFSLLLFFWAFFYFIWGFQREKELSLYWLNMLEIPVCFIHIAYFHFMLIFTNKVKAYRKLLVMGYLLSLVLVVLEIKGAFYDLNYIRNRAPFLYWPHAKPLLFLLIGTEIFYLIFSFFVLAKSIKEAVGDQKLRLKYFLLIGVIGWSGGLINWFHFFDSTPIPPIGNPAITFYLLGTSYLIFKHDIFGLNLVVKKTFIYALLTLFITLIYTVFIILSERSFQSYVGYKSIIATILAAVTIALLFNPLRVLLSKLIDKSFFGGDIQGLSTERSQMKAELEKQDRLKAVATLAAGMAHEIKNPLTSIRTFAEYLPKKYDDPDFRHKFSKIVVDEVDRVNNIVKQLLEFSKPEELVLKPCSIVAVLDETLGLLSNNLLANKIEVVKNYGTGSVGAIHESPLLKIDKNQMKQAFLNIFLNSIQAMPGGGVLVVSLQGSKKTVIARSAKRNEAISDRSGIASPRPRFLLSQESSGDHVRNDGIVISISDTGPGIPKEHLAHIFDPFFTTKESGTGLGLSIVHGIITKHGGKIEAKSEKGKGTEISVMLPSLRGAPASCFRRKQRGPHSQ